ncbi:MAG: hypothetical protein WCK02_00035 [Bacteroidota bacterium]
MKRLLFLLAILFAFVSSKAQITYNIFDYTDLGFFKPDSTYGGFSSKIGYLKVKVTNYTYDKKTQLLSFSGNVTDYLSEETFCGIYAFTGKTARKEKKLSIIDNFKVDCLGNFIITIKIEPDLKLFFWVDGYSLMECEVNKKML